MLALTAATRIFVATGPVDMRKGFDSLAALVGDCFAVDVYSGSLFVFIGKRADRVKILAWDRGGFVLYIKRLERGRFKRPLAAPGIASVALDATSLAMLLDGIDVKRVVRPRLHTPARTRGIDTNAQV